MHTFNRTLLQASWRSWISADGVRVGPWWLQWVWTVLFSAALAVPFTALGLAAFSRSDAVQPGTPAWAWWYVKNFIVCLTIGATCHVLFDVLIAAFGGGQVIRRWTPWRRSAFLGGVPLLGVGIGWPLGMWLAGADLLSFRRGGGSGLIFVSIAVTLGVVTLVIHHYFATKAKQYEAERRATEAQLRLLQGQMEPHFMFNTLANVLSLIDTDAPRARQMLETFIEYLRTSLSRLRDGDATLGDELAVTEAYLQLMRMRMEERLSYRIDVEDEALRHTAIPPLLLQPLVENAIHHGLECKVEGGSVVVTVRRIGERLAIEVADDGLGSSHTPVRRAGRRGNGVALDNARARLRSRYGDAASLELELRPDAGACATLLLPIEAPAPSP